MSSQPKRRPAASSQELVTAIRSLARLPHNVTDGKVSAETIIEALRKRGQHADAAKLEHVVETIKARRLKRPRSR